MPRIDRRRFLALLGRAGGGLVATGLAGRAALAQTAADPALAGRPLTRYPEKADLILLTSRPPQLETPMSFLDRAITPNRAFFVRYHVFPIPVSVDVDTWRLSVRGRVDNPLELSLTDLKTKFPPARLVAVAQCVGNGRGRFAPRVPGGQWGDGAMGNAEWVGARLRDVLKLAGVRQGAVDVTFDGLDRPAFPSVPDFVKSLGVTRIEDDPDVLVAYEMNGEPLPMLNGFPARLIVPGWYATYWVKNLSTIEVLDHPFDGFWMKSAYRMPDNACGCVPPGSPPGRTVPISAMNVRSFIASPARGATVAADRPVIVKGIAFDGGYGIASVQLSTDGGDTWRRAALGPDFGRYSFREWSATWTPPAPGDYRLMVSAVNRIGQSQPAQPLWNPAGYMRNVVEQVDVRAA